MREFLCIPVFSLLLAPFAVPLPGQDPAGPTAREACLAFGRALRDKDGPALVAMLPPSTLAKIRPAFAVVRDAIDGELMQAWSALLRDVDQLLRDKEELIRGCILARRAGRQVETLTKAARQLLAGLQASDLMDLDKLRQMDLETWLTEAFEALLPGYLVFETLYDVRPLGDTVNAEVETVREEGETAVLRLTRPDGTTVETEWRRRESKWLLAGFAEPEPEMSALFAALKDDAARARTIAQIRQVRADLEPLLAASDQGRFDRALLDLLAKYTPPPDDRARARAAEAGLARIRKTAKIYQLMHGGRVPTLEELTEPDARGRVLLRGGAEDPWGTPYGIEPKGERDFAVISAGPDRKFGTADDLTSN